MAVTPESILESAAAMSQGGAEVDWRNATSRACYAAYHRCRALATSIDPHADLSTAESHGFVADILQQRGSPNPARGLAYQLAALRKVRNLADYEIDDEFDQNSGRNSVEACRKILERANTIWQRLSLKSNRQHTTRQVGPAFPRSPTFSCAGKRSATSTGRCTEYMPRIVYFGRLRLLAAPVRSTI